MYKFKIEWISSRGAEEIEASEHIVDGDWIVFRDGSGQVLRVRASEVSRIARVS